MWHVETILSSSTRGRKLGGSVMWTSSPAPADPALLQGLVKRPFLHDWSPCRALSLFPSLSSLQPATSLGAWISKTSLSPEPQPAERKLLLLGGPYKLFLSMTMFNLSSSIRSKIAMTPFDTRSKSCHCEERSDVAIYLIEIASHSFAMTSINSRRLNATWYETS